MKIGYYLQTRQDDQRELAIEKLQKLYDNLMDISSILYCSCSEFVEICNEAGSSVFEKLEEIKQRSLSAIERVDNIGLTNPDFYDCDNRTETLANKIKIAKRGEVQ